MNAFADELSNLLEKDLNDCTNRLSTTTNIGEWRELMDDAIRRVQLQSIHVVKAKRLKKIEAKNLKMEVEEEKYSEEYVLENKWTIKFGNMYQPWFFYLKYKVLNLFFF